MKKYYKILIVLIVLFLLISYKNVLRDNFNMLLGLFKGNKELVIKDDMTNTYINALENEISNFKKIESMTNCINGRVIYREPTYWYDTFIINKGALDSISKGDVVINDMGLVGVIKEIYDHTSKVSLITNIDNKITVGITNKEKTIYGIISKYDKSRNELYISELTSSIEGEDAVTTSFTDTFKEGILVGKVKRTENNSDGLSKVAIVTPTVDYNNINYVCIVNNDVN